MKQETFIIIVIVLALLAILLGGIGTCVSAHYSYNLNAGQYLRLADDASDAPTKLDYLHQYRDGIHAIVGRNDARYWFKQKQYTRDTQLQILDTLIGRLEALSKTDPTTTQYQLGMQQVSGQEFDNVIDRIDGIFWAAYCRQSLWRWFWTWGGVALTSK